MNKTIKKINLFNLYNVLNIQIENIKPKTILFETTISDKVHIRVQQRTGKKHVTYIDGLNSYLDQKKLNVIITKLKDLLGCGGTIIKDDDNMIIQLNGDQRDKVNDYLIKNKIVDGDNIIMHGY